MKRNNKYLLRLWIPIVILLILVGVGSFLITSKDSTYAIIPVVVFICFFIIISRGKTGVKEALQHNTPSKLIDTIVAPLKRTPERQVRESYTAYNTALSYVFYGDYEKAIEIMNTIDWKTKEPMFQALNFNIRSLVNYFNNETHLGLSNARRAKALATTSAFPGAKKSIETYDAYVEVGEVLSRVSNDHTIQSLELKFNKLPLLPKLIIAWGLMNGYKQRNEMNGYNKMLEFCEINAPYCNSLVTIN